MELILISTLWIGVFILFTNPCASLQIQLQSWNKQAHDLQELSLSDLPRKLKLIEEALLPERRSGEQGSRFHHRMQRGDFSGKSFDKAPSLMPGRGGTMQEWMERPDASQFFTMDYSDVRRRRPIHNKSLPVGP